MSEQDSDSKTEEPTPERKRKAREEGQVARAQDASAVGASLAVLLCLVGTAPTMVRTLGSLTRRCWGEPGTFLGGSPSAMAHELAMSLTLLVLPAAGAAAIAGMAVGFLEVGFHPNLDIVAPKWNRLDPVSKLQRLFSPKEILLNITLSLARVAVVAGAAYGVMKAAVPRIARLARSPLSSGVAEVLDLTVRMAVWAGRSSRTNSTSRKATRAFAPASEPAPVRWPSGVWSSR
jgi:flagellar biosynthetic protein FlhB